MKRLDFGFYAGTFTVVFFMACLLLVFGCGYSGTIQKDAEVLSVNENILDGKMIGQFLGGSDGYLTSVVLVGLRVYFGERLFLADAKLSYAELAHYKDRNNLPIVWTADSFDGRLIGRLNGRPVVQIDISRPLARELVKEFKR